MIHPIDRETVLPANGGGSIKVHNLDDISYETSAWAYVAPILGLCSIIFGCACLLVAL